MTHRGDYLERRLDNELNFEVVRTDECAIQEKSGSQLKQLSSAFIGQDHGMSRLGFSCPLRGRACKKDSTAKSTGCGVVVFVAKR
jgi:hypothetical protein